MVKGREEEVSAREGRGNLSTSSGGEGFEGGVGHV